MALNLRFNIQESPDAKSFVFTDLTGGYNSSANPGGWGGDNITPDEIESAKLIVVVEQTTYLYNLPVGPDLRAMWEAGVEVFVQDIAYSDLQFKDGIYSFQIEYTSFDNPSVKIYSQPVIIGFASIITERVIKDALIYTPQLQKSKKDYIRETMRLLSNLRYSADTGQLQYFEDNLNALYKIR
jgi:hypothetical protein